MHSLEPEYRELHAAGLIDESAASRAIALEQGAIFSVFEEIRFALYAAVAAITTGVGILVKENLDNIGPLTLILTLALVAAACYATAIRTQLRHESRSIGGDYLLLLGALIMSADLGYAESQFHWLGTHWSWYLLILAALHAVTAYLLDSRLVLSVALTSLAGWFGVDTHGANLLELDGALRNLGLQSIVCAGAIFLWRQAHRRLGGALQFTDVFEHFAMNLGFWGVLAQCFIPNKRFVFVAVLITLAVISIRKGLRSNQEMFVIYGVAYTAVGFFGLETQIIKNFLLSEVLELVTVIAAVILLWQLHQRMKKAAA